MKRHHIFVAGSLVVLMSAGAATADCREDIAQLTSGISKDGSLAPLQEAPTDPAAQATGAEPAAGPAGEQSSRAEPAAAGDAVAKDGSTEPLNADPNLATSQEDTQAQQQGGQTAAAQAAGEAGGAETSDRSAALARAQAALDAGDEAGCLAAVKEVKG